MNFATDGFYDLSPGQRKMSDMIERLLVNLYASVPVENHTSDPRHPLSHGVTQRFDGKTPSTTPPAAQSVEMYIHFHLMMKHLRASHLLYLVYTEASEEKRRFDFDFLKLWVSYYFGSTCVGRIVMSKAFSIVEFRAAFKRQLPILVPENEDLAVQRLVESIVLRHKEDPMPVYEKFYLYVGLPWDKSRLISETLLFSKIKANSLRLLESRLKSSIITEVESASSFPELVKIFARASK